MDYFGWLNNLGWILAKELEKEVGKGFIYDQEMALVAAKHSEAMMHHGCYHAPKEYWGTARAELVGGYFTFYNDWSIGQAIKNIASGFKNSSPHYSDLCRYSVIGCGIALQDVGEGRIWLHATVRLRD